MRKRALTAVGLLVLACQTAGAQQNTTLITRERLLLAVDRLLADRWYPPGVKPPPPITPDDRGMLNAALLSGNPQLEQIAVRSLGRFENPNDIPAIARFLSHELPAIRAEAAAAIGMALTVADTSATAAAEQSFEMYMLSERDYGVCGAMYRVIGHLRYDSATYLKAQRRLAAELGAQGIVGRSAGAGLRSGGPSTVSPLCHASSTAVAQGRAANAEESSGFSSPNSATVLEALADLIHRHRNEPLLPEAQRLLVELAMPFGTTRPNIIALESLIDANAATFAIASRAANYHCVPGFLCGEDVRRLGVRMMDPNDPTMLGAIENALLDVSPLVRAEALGQLAKAPGSRFSCLPALVALETASYDKAKEEARIPAMLLEMGMLTPKCEERERMKDLLAMFIGDLTDPLRTLRWQVPALALEKFAEMVPPTEADKVIEKTALTHSIWQVRAAAARAVRMTGNLNFLYALADDREPNVRSEALTALARLRAAGTTDAALKALDSRDYQLLIVASRALAKTTRPREARDALLAALKRVTLPAADASRHARLEMFKRLKDYSAPTEDGFSLLTDANEEISRYLKDVDPQVAQAAADLLTIVRSREVRAQPTYRAPVQPDELDLIELTTMPFLENNKPTDPQIAYKADAIIQLSDGKALSLLLARDEAPLAVARFLKLARSGYYNGLTIHHFEAFRVAAGGSKGSNDYSGDARFWRDEIVPSARTVAGVVGLANHGRDTVDGRFFVGLTRLHEFDGEFTLFARVVATDRNPRIDLSPLLDGAKIARIVVPPKQR